MLARKTAVQENVKEDRAMKKAVTHTMTAAIVLLLLTACAGSGKHPVENVSSNMDQLDRDLREAVMQVDVIDASINGMIDPAESEITPAFEQYAGHVDEMERLGERLEQHADALREQGLTYFDEWRAQGETVTNPDVRAISEQRHAESREAFSQISQHSVDVKRTLQTYISDLRDIETYLANDLTPAGIRAIAPVAEQTKEDGVALQRAIRPMLSALTRARAGMGLSRGGAAD
jgi:hypothetical protein